MCVSSKCIRIRWYSRYLSGLTLGGTVVGDPAKAGLVLIHNEIISWSTIWLSRISWKQRLMLALTCSTQPRNMVAASQKLRCRSNSISYRFPITYHHRGRVIRELNLRREDLVITTKIYWGPRRGHINGGLSRKQWVMRYVILSLVCWLYIVVSLKDWRGVWSAWAWIMWMSSLLIALIILVLSRSVRSDSMLKTIVSSPHGRDRSGLQLGYWKRMGARCFLSYWYPYKSSFRLIIGLHQSGLLFKSRRLGVRVDRVHLTTTFPYFFRCRGQAWSHGSHSWSVSASVSINFLSNVQF